MTFTFTFLDAFVVSDLETENIGRETDLAKKKAQIGGLAYAYSPPSLVWRFVYIFVAWISFWFI